MCVCICFCICKSAITLYFEKERQTQIHMKILDGFLLIEKQNLQNGSKNPKMTKAVGGSTYQEIGAKYHENVLNFS